MNKPSKKSKVSSVLPIRRDYKMNLNKERSSDWVSDDRFSTHFFNALGLFFPKGERFFMDSIYRFKPLMTPELFEQTKGFMGQEAMHTREHLDYNQVLRECGYPVDKVEAAVERRIKLAQKLPVWHQLMLTVALEHYTATMAQALIKHKDWLLKDADPSYARLWLWHATEEFEHRSVSFDVAKLVAKEKNISELRMYLDRALVMFTVSAIFWGQVFKTHMQLLKHDPVIKQMSTKQKVLGYAKFVKKVWVPGKESGVFAGALGLFVDYFRWDFHPEDHQMPKSMDNLLDEVAFLAKQVEQMQMAA